MTTTHTHGAPHSYRMSFSRRMVWRARLAHRRLASPHNSRGSTTTMSNQETSSSSTGTVATTLAGVTTSESWNGRIYRHLVISGLSRVTRRQRREVQLHVSRETITAHILRHFIARITVLAEVKPWQSLAVAMHATAIRLARVDRMLLEKDRRRQLSGKAR